MIAVNVAPTLTRPDGTTFYAAKLGLGAEDAVYAFVESNPTGPGQLVESLFVTAEDVRAGWPAEFEGTWWSGWRGAGGRDLAVTLPDPSRVPVAKSYLGRVEVGSVGSVGTEFAKALSRRARVLAALRSRR